MLLFYFVFSSICLLYYRLTHFFTKFNLQTEYVSWSSRQNVRPRCRLRGIQGEHSRIPKTPAQPVCPPRTLRVLQSPPGTTHSLHSQHCKVSNSIWVSSLTPGKVECLMWTFQSHLLYSSHRLKSSELWKISTNQDITYLSRKGKTEDKEPNDVGKTSKVLYTRPTGERTNANAIAITKDLPSAHHGGK